MAKTLLVAGSSGLIGSEVCTYFAREPGDTIHGGDDNRRAGILASRRSLRPAITPIQISGHLL